MKNIIGSIIIILLGLFIIGCSNSEEKLPKTSDKLLYISIDKYSSDGNKSVGINDSIIFKRSEKPEALKDIIKIFEYKEPIKNEETKEIFKIQGDNYDKLTTYFFSKP